MACRGISKEDIDAANAAFEKYDANGDGVLDKEEFYRIIEELMEAQGVRRGRKPGRAIIRQTADLHFQELDSDKSGTIDKKEFLTLWQQLLKSRDEEIAKQAAASQELSAKPGVDYEIHYLEAPLFKAKFGDLLASADAFHGGLSFVNREDPSDLFELEFMADISVLGALMPQVVLKEESTPELYWANSASAHIVPKLAEDYWTKSQVIGTAKGEQLNELFKWVHQYNKENGFYALWQFHSHPTAPPFHNSHNCYDWVHKALEQLQRLGAEFDSKAEVKRNLISLYTKEPVEVDYNDPAKRLELLQFFGRFKQLLDLKDKPHEEIDPVLVTKLLQENFEEGIYVYHRDTYYFLELVPPFLSLVYAPHPLPGN
ncbi:hypothetical protein QOT17_010844 [Balamuthia mandrillaris]